MKLKLYIFVLAIFICNNSIIGQTFNEKIYRDSLKNTEVFSLKNELSILQTSLIIASTENDSTELNALANKMIITTEILTEKGFENGDLHFWMGRSLCILGKHPKAITIFTKGLEFDDQNDGNYEYRGYSKLLLEDFRGALSDFDKSLEKSKSKHASLYLNRGVCLMQLNQPEQAILDYSTAITKEPKNGLHYFQRGLAYLLIKKKEKGCVDLSNAGNYDYPQAYEAIRKYCN